MRFKKTVSALAALAMSVTAFAGLTIGVNAAGYSVDEVLYGVQNADGTVSVQTDFTDDANAATLDADVVFASNTFLSGSVLDASVGTITKSFSTPVTSGKVNFATAYTVVGGKTNQIKLVDKDGNMVVGLYSSDANKSANIVQMTVGTTQDPTVYTYVPRNAAYRLNYLTIDLDAKKYSYSFDLCTGGSGGAVNKVTTTKGSGSLDDSVTNIAGLSASSAAYKMDSVYLYSEKSTETLYDYSINYTLTNSEGTTTTVLTDSGSVPDQTTVTSKSVFYVTDSETEVSTKYYITADTAPSLTVSAGGTNVLDVPVRVANNYTVTLNTTVNGVTTTKKDTAVEGEDYSYAYPMYIQDGTTVYEIANNSSGAYYGGTISNVNEDKTVNLTYDKAVYDNVVICDDNDGSAGQNASVRASNCSTYDNSAYTSAVLEPGDYIISVRYVYIGRGSTMTIGDKVSQTSYLNEDGTDNTEAYAAALAAQTVIDAATDCTKNSWTTTTKEITITEAASLVWNAGGSNTYDPIDTVLVYKKPVPPTCAVAEPANNVSIDKNGNYAKGYTVHIVPNDGAKTLTWVVKYNGEVKATTGDSTTVDLTTKVSGAGDIIGGIVVLVSNPENKEINMNLLTVEATVE